MRKNARDAVYKLVFEYTYSKKINEHTKLLLLVASNISDEDKEYIEKTIDGITANFDSITDTVMKYAKGYATPDRLNRADYAALLYGAYELLYTDIPVGVAISEAINLSQEYGGEKSVGFVNGILSGINKDR